MEEFEFVVTPSLPDGTLGQTLRIKKEKRQQALDAGYTIATPEQAADWQSKRAERVKRSGEPRPEEVRVFGGGTMTLQQPETEENLIDGLPTVQNEAGDRLPYDPQMVDKIIKGNPAVSEKEAKQRAAQALALIKSGAPAIDVDRQGLARAAAVEEAGKGFVVPALTGLEQFAGTLTFGATELAEDLIGRAFDIEALRASQQAIREEGNPTISQVADVAGVVVPALGTLGTSLLPQAAARGATSVGGRLLGGAIRGAAKTDIAGNLARPILGRALGTGGAAAARTAATAELDTALAAGSAEAKAATATGGRAITDYIFMPVKAARGKLPQAARTTAIEARTTQLENAAITERLKTMGFKEGAAVAATAGTIGAATAGLSAGTRAALAESRINPDNIGETIGAQFWTNAAEGAAEGAVTGVGLSLGLPVVIKGTGELINKLRRVPVEINKQIVPRTSTLLTEADPEQIRFAMDTIIPANDANFQKVVNNSLSDLNAVYGRAVPYAQQMLRQADRIMAAEVAAGRATTGQQSAFNTQLQNAFREVEAAEVAVRNAYGSVKDRTKLDPVKIREYFKSDNSLRLTRNAAGTLINLESVIPDELDRLGLALRDLETLLAAGVAGENFPASPAALGAANLARGVLTTETPQTNVFLPQTPVITTTPKPLVTLQRPTTATEVGELFPEAAYAEQVGELKGLAFKPLTAAQEAIGAGAGGVGAAATAVGAGVAEGALQAAGAGVLGAVGVQGTQALFFDPSLAIRNLRTLDTLQKATSDALKGTAQSLFKRPLGVTSKVAGAREFIGQQELSKLPKQQDADTLYQQDKALLEKLGTIEGMDSVFGKGYETLNEQAPVAASPTELVAPRQVAFLNEKMPRPQGREPTSKEIYEYGMYARYVRNPLQIRQDIATKGYIPPQAIEVLESVYPSLVQDLRKEVIDFYLEQQAIPLNKRFFLDATGRRTVNKVLGMDITGMTPADIEKNMEALMTKPSRYKSSGTVLSPQQNLTPSQKAVGKP